MVLLFLFREGNNSRPLKTSREQRVHLHWLGAVRYSNDVPDPYLMKSCEEMSDSYAYVYTYMYVLNE